MVPLLALALAGNVHAANLLVNPNFDTDANSWQLSESSQGSSFFDAATGDPAPGSVEFNGVACCTVQVSQCVAVTAGQAYDYGAELIQGPIAPAPQSGDGIGLDLHWYNDNACATQSTLIDTLTPDVSGTWTRYGHGNVVMPVGAQSVMFRIRQYNFAALPSLTSHADSAFFGPSGTVPVQLQSFNVD